MNGSMDNNRANKITAKENLVQKTNVSYPRPICIRYDSACDYKVVVEIFKNETYSGPKELGHVIMFQVRTKNLEGGTLRGSEGVLDFGSNIGWLVPVITSAPFISPFQ